MIHQKKETAVLAQLSDQSDKDEQEKSKMFYKHLNSRKSLQHDVIEMDLVEAKTCFSSSPSIKLCYEFPRQQENPPPSTPEIMQFKASQKLLKSNESQPSANVVAKPANAKEKKKPGPKPVFNNSAITVVIYEKLRKGKKHIIESSEINRIHHNRRSLRGGVYAWKCGAPGCRGTTKTDENRLISIYGHSCSLANFNQEAELQQMKQPEAVPQLGSDETYEDEETKLPSDTSTSMSLKDATKLYGQLQSIYCKSDCVTKEELQSDLMVLQKVLMVNQLPDPQKNYFQQLHDELKAEMTELDQFDNDFGILVKELEHIKETAKFSSKQQVSKEYNQLSDKLLSLQRTIKFNVTYCKEKGNSRFQIIRDQIAEKRRMEKQRPPLLKSTSQSITNQNCVGAPPEDTVHSDGGSGIGLNQNSSKLNKRREDDAPAADTVHSDGGNIDLEAVDQELLESESSFDVSPMSSAERIHGAAAKKEAALKTAVVTEKNAKKYQKKLENYRKR